MPPKSKVKEEDILQAAFILTRTDGFESVNARNIAKKLDCSTHPIFRVYKNMSVLKQKLYLYIEEYYNQYIESKMEGENVFLSIGLAYLDFASEESNLFKMLFMSNSIEVMDFMELIDSEENQQVIYAITRLAQVDEKKARKIYINTWLFAHGIAAMLATNNLTISSEKKEELLKDAFISFKN